MAVVTTGEIRGWLERGKEQNATHVVVRSDDFSHEYYPCFCFSEQEARKKANEKGNMQRTIEVYSLAENWDAQLAQRRNWVF